MPDQGWRVGADAVGRIVTVENHDAAYHTWRDAGVKRRTLIHVDAHHDMWWIPDPRDLTIANFICRGLTEDLVGNVVWVVPDRTWEPRGRRAVLRHLRRLTETYPGSRSSIEVEPGGMSAVLLGRRLTVCTLSRLPAFDDDVLLDIDADFLVIPRVSYRTADEPETLPWCWPDQLVARLRAAGVRTDLVTIAYSVEGGYTPLKWKYLGDELRHRLAGGDGSATALEGMEAMREGAISVECGDSAGAHRRYREAAALLPASAAPSYHLALLSIAEGRTGEGQEYFRRAIALDPSYRTPYNGAGFRSYWAGRLPEAEQAFRRALLLDPVDPYAHLGLGMLAARSKRWDEAAQWLGAALALEDKLVDGHRALGDVLAHQGRPREAIAAYERSLRLALAGHKPIERPIITEAPGGGPLDPEHCAVHARLARLHASLGESATAINGYRMSLAGGSADRRVRARLAWLYWKQGNWRGAAAQAWRALSPIPARGLRRGPPSRT